MHIGDTTRLKEGISISSLWGERLAIQDVPISHIQQDEATGSKLTCYWIYWHNSQKVAICKGP